ncbi:molybdopterin molybdotransferase MoeA [Brevibacillus fortis]|uniref:molybdopterin molybdotransferase MoeA n=1 Tax=Brevibacillus fortis TaxID=2126352 RepID=UPI002E1E2515|nr:molybdopterin molybdotransferase MoeA [Brevibacillus fortis]
MYQQVGACLKLEGSVDDMDTVEYVNRFRRNAVQVVEAQHRIEQHLNLLGVEEVSLENAYSRTLAEDMIAPDNMPHFRRSGMDGFAIMSSSTRGASPESPVLLEVIDNIPCGALPTKEISPTTASRIMTGAMVPEKADAVIMLEMTEDFEEQGKTYISIRKEILPGQNLTPIGHEIKEGECVLQKGTEILAGETALLATFGFSRVKVYRRPTIAIFATGSELLPVDASLCPGKIRNSNSYMLAAQIREAGGIPLLMGSIPDDPDQAQTLILKAFSAADFVITTGGVSVGDYDILVDIFEKWEGKVLFNKVAMRPGSPTSAGVWNDQFLFALSGNPGACFVGFELFVRPVILGMQGIQHRYMREITAFLGEDFKKVNAYPRYVRGKSYVIDGKVFVKPVGMDQSSVTVSIRDSDCLIKIPPGGKGMLQGELVCALMLRG